MAGEMDVSFKGNLTRDPEVKETRSGKRFASLSIAHQARIKKGDQYGDGDPMFVNATVWARFDGDLWPDNVAASLSKGVQVVVTGRMRLEKWEARDGRTGESLRLEVEDIGPSLQRATAAVERNAKRDGAMATSDSTGWASSTSSQDAQGGQSGWGSFDEGTPF